jgi:hypothetical protein
VHTFARDALSLLRNVSVDHLGSWVASTGTEISFYVPGNQHLTQNSGNVTGSLPVGALTSMKRR